MRQYTPATSRQFPTDRNPTVIRATGLQTIVGGQTNVTIATYTVPAGRRALVTVTLDADVAQAMAAGQTGTLDARHNTNIFKRFRFDPLAVVGVRDGESIPGIYIEAGVAVDVLCTVSAGAGALAVVAGIMGVEYDA